MALHFSGDHRKHPPEFTATHFPPAGFNRRRHNSSEQHCFAQLGRGGSKAYFRFHGGMGDRRSGGVRFQATGERTVTAHRLKLFQTLNPVHRLVFSFERPFLQAESCKKVAGGFVKIPVTENGATCGTGVFLPVYPTINNNGGTCGGDGGGAREKTDFDDEIPVELLLPSEWSY